MVKACFDCIFNGAIVDELTGGFHEWIHHYVFIEEWDFFAHKAVCDGGADTHSDFTTVLSGIIAWVPSALVCRLLGV